MVLRIIKMMVVIGLIISVPVSLAKSGTYFVNAETVEHEAHKKKTKKKVVEEEEEEPRKNSRKPSFLQELDEINDSTIDRYKKVSEIDDGRDDKKFDRMWRYEMLKEEREDKKAERNLRAKQIAYCRQLATKKFEYLASQRSTGELVLDGFKTVVNQLPNMGSVYVDLQHAKNERRAIDRNADLGYPVAVGNVGYDWRSGMSMMSGMGMGMGMNGMGMGMGMNGMGMGMNGMFMNNPMMSGCSGSLAGIPSMSGMGCGGMPSGCSAYNPMMNGMPNMMGCNGSVMGPNGMVPFYNPMQMNGSSCGLCGAGSGNLPPWVSFNGGNFTNGMMNNPMFMNNGMMMNNGYNNPMMMNNGMSMNNGFNNPMMMNNGFNNSYNPYSSGMPISSPYSNNGYANMNNSMFDQQAMSNYALQYALRMQGMQYSSSDLMARDLELQAYLMRYRQAQNGMYNQMNGVNSGSYNVFANNNTYSGNLIQGAIPGSTSNSSFFNGYTNNYQIPNTGNFYGPISGNYPTNGVNGLLSPQYAAPINRTQ